jgi:hypothetical protein
MKIKSISIRPDNLKKCIFASKSFLFLLTGASLLLPSPSLAFSINRSEGQIEFSVRPVLPITPPVRNYDSTTSPTSIKGGLLTPNRGYPLISETSPLAPVQKKDGPIFPPLSDVWTVNPPGKGDANITVQAIALPTLAEIAWSANGIFLNDLVNDGNAVRNASFGSANFKTTVGALYQELAFLNVQGGIYTNRPDPWVTGSLIGKFNDAAKPHTLEILFGYDGKDRGREDFITAFLDGIEQPSNSKNFTGNLFAGENTFTASGELFSDDLFSLNIGDNVSIEGTFSCVAFNGYCGGNGGFNSQRVPEPSAVLGTFTTAMLGAGLLIKRKLKKKLELVSFDPHSKD